MHISPDHTIIWQHGLFKLNATIIWTWVLMLVLVGMSRMITRKLRTDKRPGRWQTGLESIVLAIQDQLKEIGLKHPRTYIGFIGSLFLFVAFAALCTIFPYYEPPTSSLSTTAALALAVFLAVPFFAISQRGWLEYVKTYLEPTPVMLPFNIISELSRTLAMAIRLFGNMMSGSMILGILLAITPLFFPVIMSLLGLLTGIVQAYIISILATVFIAAALTGAGDEESKNREHG
ncbi:MAG TPA: F0F1 ATP synthase subunit A [Saprospiraceae bacterium]|nr:F0F1 ATP synthase subunit A [Saprospiraceae bacterium]HRV84039.1 F0F1 ATP synthase subunit A [Saprospiraceae bacterium]